MSDSESSSSNFPRSGDTEGQLTLDELRSEPSQSGEDGVAAIPALQPPIISSVNGAATPAPLGIIEQLISGLDPRTLVELILTMQKGGQPLPSLPSGVTSTATNPVVFVNTTTNPTLDQLSYQAVLDFIQAYKLAKQTNAHLTVAQCLTPFVTNTLNDHLAMIRGTVNPIRVGSIHWDDDSIMEAVLERVIGTDLASARLFRQEKLREMNFEFDPRSIETWDKLKARISAILSPWPGLKSAKLKAFWNERQSAEYKIIMELIKKRAKEVPYRTHYAYLLDKLQETNLKFLVDQLFWQTVLWTVQLLFRRLRK